MSRDKTVTSLMAPVMALHAVGDHVVRKRYVHLNEGSLNDNRNRHRLPQPVLNIYWHRVEQLKSAVRPAEVSRNFTDTE